MGRRAQRCLRASRSAQVRQVIACPSSTTSPSRNCSTTPAICWKSPARTSSASSRTDKAASAIRAWPEQLSVLAEEARLTEVPGVGKKLAVAIGQILSTGTFAEYEEVLARYPATLAEVMKVPSVGPVRARMLYEPFRSRRSPTWRRLSTSGRLSEVGGLREKTVANIAAGLQVYLRTHGRTMLMDALPLTEHMLATLRATPAVEQAEPAGLASKDAGDSRRHRHHRVFERPRRSDVGRSRNAGRGTCRLKRRVEDERAHNGRPAGRRASGRARAATVRRFSTSLETSSTTSRFVSLPRSVI